jgi:hypothetical protein
MNIPRRGALVPLLAVGMALGAQERVLHRSDAFEVTPTRVRQGAFEAVARGRDTLVSTYPRAAQEVHFKFALNGEDNEFPPGIEHVVHLRPRGGRVVTPTYVFGREPSPATPVPRPDDGEEGAMELVVSLDLRAVRDSLRRAGRYRTPQGRAITRLERVTIIGDAAPLQWDIRRAAPQGRQELRDPDGDGIWTVSLPFEARFARPRDATGAARWVRRADLAGLPTLTSPEPLLDATWRLSLEELRELVRADGALAAGAKWPGVWTRDISLAALLSLASIVPDAVKTSLLAKVDASGRIIQDTGTGGSWPISTDRLVWALAAWEVYTVTGDRGWLERAYAIIARSVEADRHAAIDPATGLVTGETSFLDWREQSYPRWMQPADIARSQAIGTNAIHHGAYRILGRMATLLGGGVAAEAPRWTLLADSLRTAVDRALWLPAAGHYAMFRYGRLAPLAAPRAEALGQALAVLLGVADGERAAQAIAASPQLPFGTPTFWPSIDGVPAYHNRSIWPFVTAYATWAAADVGNTAVVEHGLATLWRGVGLQLTNKENLLDATGHFEGTALNSDRQLWSVAGTLAMQTRVLFGLRFDADSLRFRPMVPPSYGGTRVLTGVRWRKATLAIAIVGHGRGIRRLLLDGKPLAGTAIPASLTGPRSVRIELDDAWPSSPMTRVAPRLAPATPEVRRAEGLAWPAVPGADRYRVVRDGAVIDSTRATAWALPTPRRVEEWQVIAVAADGTPSYASEPVRVVPPAPAVGDPFVVEVAPAGAARPALADPGTPPSVLSVREGPPVAVPVRMRERARWRVEWVYANGSGPINTADKAAIRTLLVDGVPAGVVILPQRGAGRWDDFGVGTGVDLLLEAGAHTLSLVCTPLDANMHRDVNTARIAAVRLTRLP